MGASRTSNKDILAAIDAQTSAINALVGAISGTVNNPPAKVIDTTSVTDPEPESNTTVRVAPSYDTHMRDKAQDHATAKGEAVVMYARRNLAGETKLAYCLKSRWTSLRDRGLIGAVAEFQPK